MKKNFLILFLCFICFSFTSNKNISIKGSIIAAGNDPFVYPVLKSDKKEYQLKSETFNIKDLLKEQGKIIEIKGYIEKLQYKETDVLIINVESYRVIK